MPRHDGSTCGYIEGHEDECACGCTAYEEACDLCFPGDIEAGLADLLINNKRGVDWFTGAQRDPGDEDPS